MRRKRKARHRLKVYRERNKLSDLFNQEKRRADRLKKRLQRLQKSANQPSSGIKESPRKMVKRMVQGKTINRSFMRTLLLQCVLTQSLKKKFKNLHSTKDRQVLQKVVVSSLIRKYHLRTLAQKELGLCRRKNKHVEQETTDIRYRSSKKPSKKCSLLSKVEEFYCCDDTSRMAAGKKETVTRKKKKMQKRFLNDTMANLHKKYLSENPDSRMSYTLFCALHPFWVVHPTSADRDTCRCKRHENLQLKADKLHQLGSIPEEDIDKLASAHACDCTSKACMYHQCDRCKHNCPRVKIPPDMQADNHVWWWKWKHIVENRPSKDGTHKVKVIRKVKVEGKLQELIDDFYDEVKEFGKQELIDDFYDEVKEFGKHSYNISHQYSAV